MTEDNGGERNSKTRSDGTRHAATNPRFSGNSSFDGFCNGSAYRSAEVHQRTVLSNGSPSTDCYQRGQGRTETAFDI